MKATASIRDSITNGNLKKAVTDLKDEFSNHELLNHELKNLVILLVGRYKSLEKKDVMGTITSEENRVEENKISYSILTMLNDIDKIHTDKTLVNVKQNLDDKSTLKKLMEILDQTNLGFQSQARERERLCINIKKRLGIVESLQYEEFFHKYFSKMNQEELGFHSTLRYYTKNILYKYNKKALELIIGKDKLKEELPKLKSLERHLLVWLGKFERLFENTPSIGLIYVGVDEENPIPSKKVPFPNNFDEELENYLAKEK